MFNIIFIFYKEIDIYVSSNSISHYSLLLIRFTVTKSCVHALITIDVKNVNIAMIFILINKVNVLFNDINLTYFSPNAIRKRLKREGRTPSRKGPTNHSFNEVKIVVQVIIYSPI